MTILDFDLFICQNARPAFTPAAPTAGVLQLGLFAATLTPNYFDMLVAMDAARGTPLYANFRIDTAFTNIAANYARFIAIADNSTSAVGVTTNSAKMVARSPDIQSAGLAAVGEWITLALPPLSPFVFATDGTGCRYLFLGMEAYVPTTDWSAGGVTACITAHPLQQQPVPYASGY